MKSAIVTGGAGFVGSHVADQLLKMGLKVVVLDDMSGGFFRNVPAGAVFEQGSICDAKLIERLFNEHRFNYVFHLAAYAAEGLSAFIRRFNYETNLIGSVNLINASVNFGVECFVFTSSMAVYGEATPPFHEEQAGSPIDPYGISKWSVEQDLGCARETMGLRSIVFRPHNVYGDRQNLSDPYRNVVGIFLRQTLQGKRCTVFGDGKQTRAFSHIDEVAPIIAKSVLNKDAYDRVFNVGSDHHLSILDLAEKVQRMLGSNAGIEFLPKRHEAREAYSHHRNLCKVFGPLAKVDLDLGLERMAAWARTLEFRAQRRVAQVEIAKNLPPSWAALHAPPPRQRMIG